MRAILWLATRLADPLKPLARRLLPRPALDRLARAYKQVQSRRVLTEPDRQFLSQTLLPALAETDAQALLFVGVRHYTLPLLDQFQRLVLHVWTLDIDPEAAAFGQPGRHLTADITAPPPNALPRQQDAAIVNGVMGYGVDSPAQCADALRQIAALLRPGGWLVLGWNLDRCADPAPLAQAAGLHRASLPGGIATQAFPGSTHRFDIFRKPVDS